MIPAPRTLKAFPQATKTRPKTPRAGGGLRHRWKDPIRGTIYEWDSQHGRIEAYNRLGRHLGEFDPDSGEMTKPADPQRRITPLQSAVRIVGYDASEEMAVEVPVPTRKLRKARELACVPETDPELLGAYPLSETAARAIADVPSGLSYFLEAAID